MLRNIIIIGTTSGLVLFSKEFANTVAHPRMMGNLLTTIREFGQQTTGMSLSYLELSNIAVTMVANEDAKIFCALFYDREDGVAFGRLICSEILNAFTQEYSSEFTQFGRNLKDFYGFQKKIITIVRFSPKPILMKLSSQVGIKRVFLVNDRDVIDTPGSKVDQLSVLANLNALTDLCNGMMSSVNDAVQHMAIDTEDDHSILMWRIQERSILVVAVDKKVRRDVYFPHIDEALEIIEQVCILHANLELIAR